MVGRSAPIEIYEVLCETGSSRPACALEADYLRAWRIYAEGRFVEAAQAFDALAKEWPNDGPVGVMRARCREYSRISVEGFDATFDMSEK